MHIFLFKWPLCFPRYLFKIGKLEQLILRIWRNRRNSAINHTISAQTKFSVRGDTKYYCKYPDLAAILAVFQPFLRSLIRRTSITPCAQSRAQIPYIMMLNWCCMCGKVMQFIHEVYWYVLFCVYRWAWDIISCRMIVIVLYLRCAKFERSAK